MASLATLAAVFVQVPAQAAAPRYLNLHECRYYLPEFADHFVTVRRHSLGGTNVSNAADSAVNCRSNLDFSPGSTPEGFPYGYIYLWTSKVAALDLTAGRYLNLHQCVIYNGNDPDLLTTFMPSQIGGTNVSNVPDSRGNCLVPAAPGWAFMPDYSGVVALDLTAGRYLNLHQCVYYNPGTRDFHTTLLPTSYGGTNVSNVAETGVNCAPPAAGIYAAPAYSAVMSFDLLS